jgi:hypothetical protein
MIAFGKCAGVEEIPAQSPILALGNETFGEGARDFRQGPLDFFERRNVTQHCGFGTYDIEKFRVGEAVGGDGIRYGNPYPV